MNNHMKEVFITVAIGLTFILLATSIGFFCYKATLNNHETSKACIAAGGEWMIWEDSAIDDPLYECVR